MRPKRWLLFPLISMLLTFSGFSQAQQWVGIIAPSRAVDWTNLAGVPGGIPSSGWTQSGSTINACSGQSCADSINNALSACGSNRFVKLGPGTFNLVGTDGITMQKSNCVLRGSGADQTKMLAGRAGCHGFVGGICLIDNSGLDVNSASTHNVTGGLSKGSSVLTLDSASSLSVGMYIGMDQLNDSDTDNRQIWVCQTGKVCVDEGPGGGQRGGQARGQMQYFKITAINGSQITVTPPVLMPNWSTSKSPQVFFLGSQVSFMGVEDLSIDWTNSTAISGISLFNCNACWVKGVRVVTLTATDGSFDIRVFNSPFPTIRDNYIYGSQRAQTTSYGIEPYMTSNMLIENNVFQHQASPIVFSGGGVGSVVAYNHSYDNYWQVDPSSMAGMTWLHDAGADLILHEGNDGQGFWSDDIHGTHALDTVFRNRYAGIEPADSNRTGQNEPIIIRAVGRYFNVIGNVLGTTGRQNSYSCVAPPFDCPGTPSPSIFSLGDPQHSDYLSGGDSLVATTVMRWGNYDTFNAATRFVNSEVPSNFNDGSGSPSLYVNPVPGSQTLPASFYLNSKPSWFGSVPWPPIGPDVTGGDISGVGGHAYKIPARVCFESLADDTSYSVQNGARPRIFNADNCYGDPPPPPDPPTGLSAVVN